MAGLPAERHEQCARACCATPGCSAFTFNERVCWLKDGAKAAARRLPAGGLASGRRASGAELHEAQQQTGRAVGQWRAALAPLLLVAVVGFEALTFTTMLCYAVLMGTAQAFVTPARDGLLTQVAEGRVQRAVMLTSVIQFGLQIAGFALAALLDTVGAIPILAAQSLVLAAGVFVFSRIHPGVERRHSGPSAPLLQSVLEGARTVFASPSMRMIVVQNVAMAMFFMGSIIVTMPLLVREVFDGSAGDLAFVNTCNSLGLVSSILFLLRFGDVRRQGRDRKSTRLNSSHRL